MSRTLVQFIHLCPTTVDKPDEDHQTVVAALTNDIVTTMSKPSSLSNDIYSEKFSEGSDKLNQRINKQLRAYEVGNKPASDRTEKFYSVGSAEDYSYAESFLREGFLEPVSGAPSNLTEIIENMIKNHPDDKFGIFFFGHRGVAERFDFSQALNKFANKIDVACFLTCNSNKLDLQTLEVPYVVYEQELDISEFYASSAMPWTLYAYLRLGVNRFFLMAESLLAYEKKNGNCFIPLRDSTCGTISLERKRAVRHCFLYGEEVLNGTLKGDQQVRSPVPQFEGFDAPTNDASELANQGDDEIPGLKEDQPPTHHYRFAEEMDIQMKATGKDSNVN